MQKIFTFLGTGDYKETGYYLSEKEEVVVTTKFIQTALYKLFGPFDQMVVIGTETSFARNWLDEGEKVGLKTFLEQENIPYRRIQIPEGRNQEELWKTFQIIYEEVDTQDKVVVDITHSLRSIPVMIMSILQYAKMMKDIQVNGIYYGAFEMRKVDSNVSPIFNMLPFDEVMVWSNGVDQLLTSGSYDAVEELLKVNLSPILSEAKGSDPVAKQIKLLGKLLVDFFDNLKFAKGLSTPKVAMEINGILDELDALDFEAYDQLKLRPFLLLIDRIKEPFRAIKGIDFIKDLHIIVRLCKDFGLYQQAFTLLRENIVNVFCLYVEIELTDNLVGRLQIEKIIMSHFDWMKLPEAYRRNIGLDEKEKALDQKLENLLTEEHATLFRDISDFRNTLNHAEFRKDNPKNQKIKDNLNTYIKEFESLFITTH